jgi:8-oxo-dGTP pyrophosphatase MutT (NUDIX family)
MTKKTSYGIALCRYNKEKNNRVEVLMIKKRYSYHFFNFVFGRYKTNDANYLKYLFNNMSFAEKIDILGMQFENMWYRIWLNNPSKHYDISDVYNIDTKQSITNAEKYRSFFQKKSKFEKNFVSDGGKRLKELICQSSDAEIIWEMPKGGKTGNETNIDCAMREFLEETSISNRVYKILHSIDPAIEIIIESDITYQHLYYIAKLRNSAAIHPKINFKNFAQISEVEQIKWISLDEIEFMCLSKEENIKLKKIYNDVVKKFKKSQKITPLPV